MNIKCTGCGKERTDNSGYGTYSGDRTIEWVCDECWAKGVRTEAVRKSRGDKHGS